MSKKLTDEELEVIVNEMERATDEIVKILAKLNPKLSMMILGRVHAFQVLAVNDLYGESEAERLRDFFFRYSEAEAKKIIENPAKPNLKIVH